MPSDTINTFFRTQLDDLKAKGLYKAERRIESPQTLWHHASTAARS